MASTSVKFVLALFYDLYDCAESRVFVKELIFDHMCQFPHHSSTKALLGSIRTYVQTQQKLSTWLTPPLAVYTAAPNDPKGTCGSRQF